jgi:hypothetical protein
VESSDQPRDEPGRLFYLHAGAGLGTVSTPAGLSGVWTEGQGWNRGGQHGPVRRTITYDSVPRGEVQVRRGDHVRATDGKIGLIGVLLQEGHLWAARKWPSRSAL